MRSGTMKKAKEPTRPCKNCGGKHWDKDCKKDSKCRRCGGKHLERSCSWSTDVECHKCKEKCHTQSVCTKQLKTNASNNASSIEQTLASTFHNFSVKNHRSLATTGNGIPHMAHCDNKCKIQGPTNKPWMKVKIEISPADYNELKHKAPIPTKKPPTISALADTGCDSSIAGLDLLRKMGLTKNDLLKISGINLKAANNSQIKLEGALIVKITGDGKNGNYSNKQILYITAEVEGVLLSRDTCIPRFARRLRRACAAG